MSQKRKPSTTLKTRMLHERMKQRDQRFGGLNIKKNVICDRKNKKKVSLKKNKKRRTNRLHNQAEVPGSAQPLPFDHPLLVLYRTALEVKKQDELVASFANMAVSKEGEEE